MSDWYDDDPVRRETAPPDQASRYLRAMGEHDTGPELSDDPGSGRTWSCGCITSRPERNEPERVARACAKHRGKVA